ncbi:MAG: hypothetical protein AB8E82_01120 [Aureispira sp.]
MDKIDRNTEKTNLELELIRKKILLLEQLHDNINAVMTTNTTSSHPNILSEPAMTYQVMPHNQEHQRYYPQRTNLYGTVVLVGGSNAPILCLDTAEHGIVTIQIPKRTLLDYERNLLYSEVGVVVDAQKSIQDDNIQHKEAVFVAFLDYGNKAYTANRLDALIQKASQEALDNKVPDNWLEQLRGTSEE